MKGWSHNKLDNITIKIGSGATPTGGEESYKETGISLIRSLNVYDYSFSYKNLAYIDEKQARKLNNVTVCKNDILLNITGASVGRCCLLPSHILPARVNQHVSIIRVLAKELHSKFLLYYLNTPSNKDRLLNLSATGATREALTKDDISNFVVSYPPLPIQRKIAAILSAYDDLIENNNRRIAILEKIAEELYREWFVRLRFPGHVKVKIIKGVPEGWEVKRIGECFKTYLGGTPSREIGSYWGGNIPWINSGEVNNLRIIKASEFITESGYNKSATCMMPVHTTVLAITGATLGQVSFTELNVCANQSVVGINDNADIYNYYIFGYVKAIIQNIIAKQGGGGQQHINKDIVEKEEIIIPEFSVIEKYNKIIYPIFKKIANLYFEETILKQSRDRLLSRLMSGKIDVENLDIQFPKSMQEEVTANA